MGTLPGATDGWMGDVISSGVTSLLMVRRKTGGGGSARPWKSGEGLETWNPGGGRDALERWARRTCTRPWVG